MIYHYYGGGSSGVFRFNEMLRRAFPEMVSVTKLPELAHDDLVITDNHLSFDVAPEVRTVVVHHGCAQAHYDRDPAWRNPRTRQIVEKQKDMFSIPNRTYVAPSAWVGLQFQHVCPRGIDYSCRVIPHWVDRMEPIESRLKTPLIVGDWRDYNKGAAVWKTLQKICPDWDFAPLAFRNDEEKRIQYGDASLYLCLALAEGGSYSMCDAEAASLPIVTTNVGNYREFSDCAVIRWEDRDNVDLVATVIEEKLAVGRVGPSFYRDYTFDVWKQKWEAAIQ